MPVSGTTYRKYIEILYMMVGLACQFRNAQIRQGTTISELYYKTNTE
jgi:hypothetical protein